MIIENIATGAKLTLPNDMLWVDEFRWVETVATNTFTLSGSLIIEEGVKKAGRPITLSFPDDSMAWVTRDTIQKLRAMVSSPASKFKLSFEYETDKRSFIVVFDHSQEPISAEPVKGFPCHNDEDWFRVSLKMIEVKA